MNDKPSDDKKINDQSADEENTPKILKESEKHRNDPADKDEESLSIQNEPTLEKTSIHKTNKNEVDSRKESNKLPDHSRKFQSKPISDKENVAHSSYISSASKSKGERKEKRPFPKTKKYRYYPVTCEYCRKHFQPTVLKAHQQKHHPAQVSPVQTVKLPSPRKDLGGQKESKKAGGIAARPRLQICYICGRMYGTKSLALHEPNCLQKWRIQNEQLPPHKRAPEPVKPEPIAPVSGKKGYSVPGFDPAAEAAYKSHLKTLIPCSYCSRTFSPDRIMVHESCCIERPRKRKRITSKKGKRKK